MSAARDDRGSGRAAQLRQARRAARLAHARRRGRRGRARRGVRERARRLARERRPAQPRGVAAHGGAPQVDRRGSAAPHRRGRRGPPRARRRRDRTRPRATSAQLPDERLALMFACAHPAIDAAVRAPLILQTILGFDAAAIGSAFLVSPADDGPAPRAREEEDPRGGHPVPAARARRARAAPRRGARGDLRRVRGGLVRPGRHRGARPQPRRRGRSGSGGSSRRCCPRRPRRSGCSR